MSIAQQTITLVQSAKLLSTRRTSSAEFQTISSTLSIPTHHIHNTHTNNPTNPPIYIHSTTSLSLRLLLYIIKIPGNRIPLRPLLIPTPILPSLNPPKLLLLVIILHPPPRSLPVRFRLRIIVTHLAHRLCIKQLQDCRAWRNWTSVWCCEGVRKWSRLA